MGSINELDIVLRQKSGKVVASIPQLGLYGIGPNATSALSALEQKKAALLDDMKAAEVPDEFERVAWSAGSPMRVQRGNLRQFLLKVLIVVVLLSAATLIPAWLLATKIQKDLAGFSTGGRQFWTKLESELGRAADPSSDLPEAKKRKILSDLRAIVERWRPYAAQLGPLFSDLRGETPRTPQSCN